MHPAPSVILFSSLSGLGFGILAWLGFVDIIGGAAFGYYFLGYALAVGGLLFSVFHLGNKKNAIKAFREWRSSWLSREGIASIAALLLVGLEAIARIFLATSLGPIAWLGSLLCIFTVFTTSMIYAQLKTVPRWNTSLTPALFLGFCVIGGATLFAPKFVVILGLGILTIIQIFHWIKGDQAFTTRGGSIEEATGLGIIGRVRMLEPPHEGENYLLKEMAYRIGRKHALKLRVITLVCAFLLPALMLLMSAKLALLALGVHLIGVFASRWLFFAEAQHVVSHYYDR